RLGEEMPVDEVVLVDPNGEPQIGERLLPGDPGSQERDSRSLMVEASQDPVSASFFEGGVESDDGRGVVANLLSGSRPGGVRLARDQGPFAPGDGRPEERRRRVGVARENRRDLARRPPFERGDSLARGAPLQDADRLLTGAAG